MSSNIRITRVCQFCGDSFTAKTTVTKYCGDRCAKLAYKKRKREEKLKSSNQETKQIIQAPLIEIQAKEYLSIKETVQITGLSRTTLWRLIKANKLQVGRFGKRVIIRKKDLEKLF